MAGMVAATNSSGSTNSAEPPSPPPWPVKTLAKRRERIHERTYLEALSVLWRHQCRALSVHASRRDEQAICLVYRLRFTWANRRREDWCRQAMEPSSPLRIAASQGRISPARKEARRVERRAK